MKEWMDGWEREDSGDSGKWVTMRKHNTRALRLFSGRVNRRVPLSWLAVFLS